MSNCRDVRNLPMARDLLLSAFTPETLRRFYLVWVSPKQGRAHRAEAMNSGWKIWTARTELS